MLQHTQGYYIKTRNNSKITLYEDGRIRKNSGNRKRTDLTMVIIRQFCFGLPVCYRLPFCSNVVLDSVMTRFPPPPPTPQLTRQQNDPWWRSSFWCWRCSQARPPPPPPLAPLPNIKYPFRWGNPDLNKSDKTKGHFEQKSSSERKDYRLNRVQELCESRGGRHGLSVLTSFMVSVDVKQYWTMLTHWSQFVPNMSTDIRGH